MRDLTGSIAAFVLAGGRSRRFGRDKALALWRGKPLMEHVLGALEPFHPVAVLARRTADYAGRVAVPVLEDVWPDRGPLGGVVTGLRWSPQEWNLFVACDLPRLQRSLLRLLDEHIDAGTDAVVPRVDGWWVPTLALYRRALLPALEEALLAGRLSLQALLKELRVTTVPEAALRAVDPTLESFLNANTPETLSERKDAR